MRQLSLEEQKASAEGIFPSIGKSTVVNPKLLPDNDHCPVFGCHTRMACKLIPEAADGGIRIGAHHQGFGRSPPNTSPHLEPPARVKNFDEKVLTPMRSKRPSFASTPYNSKGRIDFSDLTKPDASSPRASQKIDISKSHVPMPVEIRVVIWKLRHLDRLTKRIGASTVPPSYIAGHIGHRKVMQKTDIAWSSVKEGEAEFNWRMKFLVDVSGNLDSDDVRFQLVLDSIPVFHADKHSSEMRYWSMALQPAGLIESLRVEAGLTCPLLSQLKCFGTCKLDLKKRLKAMRIRFDKIQHNRVKTMQPVEVFEDQIKPDLGTPQNARWVEFGHVDTPDESCEALISISLVPQDYALKWPQGEGRAIPNDSPYLAPPKRVQSKKEKEEKMDCVPILSAPPGLDKKKST